MVMRVLRFFLLPLLLLLRPVTPYSQRLGRLQLFSVSSSSGAWGAAWDAVPLAIELAVDLINAQNGGDGLLFRDSLGTQFSLLLNYSSLDDGSIASNHSASLSYGLNSSRSFLGPSSTYNPISVEDPFTFRGVQALIGIQPQFTSAEAREAMRTGVLHMQCCTQSKTAASILSVGPGVTPLTYSMQPTVAKYAVSYIAALLQRGLGPVGLIYSLSDPLTVEACSTAADALGQAGIKVAFVNRYKSAATLVDAPYVWTYESGLGGGDRAAAPYASQADEADLAGWAALVATNMSTFSVSDILHCGLSQETAALLSVLLIDRKDVVLSSFYSFPALSQLEEISMPFTTAASAPTEYSNPPPVFSSYFANSGLPTSVGRFLSTATSWSRDARYNDSVLGDSATFTVAFAKKYHRLPTWREAAAASSVSVLTSALVTTLSNCQVLYPVLFHILYADTALRCGGVGGGGPGSFYGRGYVQWLATLSKNSFFTLMGPVRFDQDERWNSAAVPLIQQLQASAIGTYSGATVAPLLSNPSLSLPIVLPEAQAQCAPLVSRQNAQVPSGTSALPYPASHGLIYPMPGAAFIDSASVPATAVVVACLIFAGLFIAALAFIYCHRRKTAIKEGIPVAMAIQLLGCLAGVLWLALLIGPANSSDIACQVRVVVPTFAVTCVLAPIIGRSFHIQKQYSDDVTAMEKWAFRGKHAILWTLGALGIDVGLLFLYIVGGRTRAYRCTCHASWDSSFDVTLWLGIALYKFLLCIIACILLRRIRFLTQPFDEGHYQAIIAYHMLFAICVAVIVLLTVVLGSWSSTNIEALAATNPHYAYPTGIYSSVILQPAANPFGSQLASFTLYMGLSLWIASFTMAMLLTRKVVAALGERNALVEAALMRERKKKEAEAKLHEGLRDAAKNAGPMGGSSAASSTVYKGPEPHFCLLCCSSFGRLLSRSKYAKDALAKANQMVIAAKASLQQIGETDARTNDSNTSAASNEAAASSHAGVMADGSPGGGESRDITMYDANRTQNAAATSSAAAAAAATLVGPEKSGPATALEESMSDALIRAQDDNSKLRSTIVELRSTISALSNGTMERLMHGEATALYQKKMLQATGGGAVFHGRVSTSLASPALRTHPAMHDSSSAPRGKQAEHQGYSSIDMSGHLEGGAEGVNEEEGEEEGGGGDHAAEEDDDDDAEGVSPTRASSVYDETGGIRSSTVPSQAFTHSPTTQPEQLHGETSEESGEEGGLSLVISPTSESPVASEALRHTNNDASSGTPGSHALDSDDVSSQHHHRHTLPGETTPSPSAAALAPSSSPISSSVNTRLSMTSDNVTPPGGGARPIPIALAGFGEAEARLIKGRSPPLLMKTVDAQVEEKKKKKLAQNSTTNSSPTSTPAKATATATAASRTLGSAEEEEGDPTLPPAPLTIAEDGYLTSDAVQRQLDAARTAFLRQKTPITLAIRDAAEASASATKARQLAHYFGKSGVAEDTDAAPSLDHYLGSKGDHSGPPGGVRPLPLHLLAATKAMDSLSKTKY